MPWIVDPTFDDHDLLSYLCGPSAPNATCGALRSCELDANLANATAACGATGCFVCLHKALKPLGGRDFLTAAALAVCGVLAGASGIGGGGLNVPVLMLTSNFLVDEAVPLSHVAVSGPTNRFDRRQRRANDAACASGVSRSEDACV